MSIKNCLLLTAFVALVGCKPASSIDSGNVLAEVNGQPITEQTYRHWWKRNMTSVDDMEARNALLNQLVDRSVLTQKAIANGIDRDPEVIEAFESLLIARFKEKELQPKIEAITVGDDEARVFYEAHKAQLYSDPARSHVAVLWFETRGQEPLTARYRPRLEKAREQILGQGANVSSGFGLIALDNSEHMASRYKGGDIGWIDENNEADGWRKAVGEIAVTLSQPGDISPVVARKEGVFVVRLIERRTTQLREFAAVRSEILRHLRIEKRNMLQRNFFTELNAASVIQAYPERLKALSDLPVHSEAVASIKSNQTTFRPQL